MGINLKNFPIEFIRIIVTGCITVIDDDFLVNPFYAIPNQHQKFR